MNSMTVWIIGNLVRDPEMKRKGDTAYTRFGVVSTDYTRQPDGTTRARATFIWMVAFHSVAKQIVRRGRVGDQIFARGRIINTSWLHQGKRRNGYSFICDDVKFGRPGRAKREAVARVGREGLSVDGDAQTADHSFAVVSAEGGAVDQTLLSNP